MISATDMYVITVIFLAALIRSTVGFGEALVAVPNAINLSHKSLWYIYLHIFAHW